LEVLEESDDLISCRMLILDPRVDAIEQDRGDAAVCRRGVEVVGEDRRCGRIDAARDRGCVHLSRDCRLG
jgi:hypothetical protein